MHQVCVDLALWNGKHRTIVYKATDTDQQSSRIKNFYEQNNTYKFSYLLTCNEQEGGFATNKKKVIDCIVHISSW